MPTRALTPAQQAWRSGYERGSVAAGLSPERRRAFRAWLRGLDADLRCMERQAASQGLCVSRYALRSER